MKIIFPPCLFDHFQSIISKLSNEIYFLFFFCLNAHCLLLLDMKLYFKSFKEEYMFDLCNRINRTTAYCVRFTFFISFFPIMWRISYHDGMNLCWFIFHWGGGCHNRFFFHEAEYQLDLHYVTGQRFIYFPKHIKRENWKLDYKTHWSEDACVKVSHHKLSFSQSFTAWWIVTILEFACFS